MQLIEDTSKHVKAMSHGSDVARIKRKDDNVISQRQFDNNHAYKRCKCCDRKHPQQKELCPAWGKHALNVRNKIRLLLFVYHPDQLGGSIEENSGIQEKTSEEQEMNQQMNLKRIHMGQEFIEQSISHLKVG